MPYQDTVFAKYQMTKPQHFKRTARKELTLFPDELLEIIKAAESQRMHPAAWLRALALTEARKLNDQGARH